MALIEMGDFAGAVLKHLRKTRLSRLSICGGFGKVSKLACGNMDLNSRSSSIDFQYLADVVGGGDQLTRQILSANTSLEAFMIGRRHENRMADLICRRARKFARSVAGDGTDIEVFAVDREGAMIGHAGFSA